MQRQLFLQHVAQTSMEPMALPITKAKESILYDDFGHQYIDLIGGISVSSIGHSHPKVVKAIQDQAAAFLHVMVYGEAIITPQVEYAQLLASVLPAHLNAVYFVNSGSEAVEGAMKLAKRVTGRTEIIACHNSYHGSTQGAMSIMGSEYWRNSFRPLLPNIRHIEHNNFESLQYITDQTACIILEVIQAEGGVLVPQKEWLQALRKKCTDVGALLIFDEIQTGFGRTGSLWAFEQFGIEPDVLLLGKALGGGMPLGAFIASKDMMDQLTTNPILGHMTTFGGHPVCCAAGKAALEVILEEGLIAKVKAKGELFKAHLKHPKIKNIRGLGLMMAVELEDFEAIKQLIKTTCLDLNKPSEHTNIGIFTDWFLFCTNSFRIVPPLNISDENIVTACKIIKDALDKMP